MIKDLKNRKKKNRGKEFEGQFQDDWKRCFDNKKLCFRLKDDVSHKKGTAKNPCDFICEANGHVYMVETKSHYENRFPWTSFSQLDLLEDYIDVDNCRPTLVVWYIDYDVVVWIPVKTVVQMIDDGYKAFNLRELSEYEQNDYKYLFVPTVKKKRVFLDSDYYSIINRDDLGDYYDR